MVYRKDIPGNHCLKRGRWLCQDGKNWRGRIDQNSEVIFSSDKRNVVAIWEDSGESREDICWAMIVLQALGYVLFLLYHCICNLYIHLFFYEFNIHLANISFNLNK